MTADTTGSYSIIQSAVVHAGSEAFQLAFPADTVSGGAFQDYDFDDQSFEVTRQIVPTASSQLQFYDLCRFALPSTTLSAQVSTDNGLTWTTVWTRDGVVPSGQSSTDWDPAFILNDVSLAAYAGQVILVRFDLSGNGQAEYLGTTSSFGFFIDDITVTNATQLTNITDTTLAAGVTSFMLNSTTAGRGLAVRHQLLPAHPARSGAEMVRLRPIRLGDRDRVDRHRLLQLVSATYPTVTGGATGDFSGDGIPNALKYAFGLNPTVHNPGSAVPTPVVSSSSLSLSFTAPAGIVGVTYGAQWSTDLVNWTNITDTGTGNTHTFTVTSPGARAFIRQHITVSP